MEGEDSNVVLKTWATLYALNAIKRSLDAPHNLHFEWNKPDKLETFEQEFYIEEAENCLSKVVEKIEKLGIDVFHNGIGKNNEETKSNYIDIESVLTEIGASEKRFSENLTLDQLQHLLALYQKVSCN